MFVVLSIILLVSSPALAKDRYFGVKILDSKMLLTALSNVRENAKGNILYSIQRQYADDSICAYATVGSHDITYTIKNDSKAPLKMNFFSDKFELMTSDESIFELEKPQRGISTYPKIVNPGESASVRVVGYKGKAENVKYLSATIGLSNTFIFLVKVNPTDPESANQRK
jgi:hypothetical protein